MIKVVIESPYSGDVENNLRYLFDCMLDCLSKGESPYASHALFTQFLDDDFEHERELGINAGLAWADCADYIVVYTDRGISEGMQYAIDQHIKNHRIVEYRKLPGENLK